MGGLKVTDEEIQEWIDERAAIIWVDGDLGLDLEEAESLATAQFWSQYDED